MRSSLGSIQKIESGYYKVTATVGIDQKTGKQKRRSKRVRGSKREAEIVLNQLIATGDVTNENITLAEVACEYLESKKDTIRKPTWQEYERLCKIVYESNLASVQIKKLENGRGIEAWIKSFENDWGKRSAYKILRQIFNYAKSRHYIKESPLDYIKEPKTKRHKIEVVTSANMPLYLEAVKNTDIEAGVLVMLYMGLRRSEALARKWQDIDFENGTISIYSTLRELKGGGLEIGETKTEKSKRIDYIPTRCLERLKVIQKGKWLCEYNGDVMKPDYFGRRWRSYIKRAGLPQIQIKNLRHSCGTMLIREMGASVSDVAELLGHTTTLTTEKYYLQQSDESKKRVAKLWDKERGVSTI